MKDKHDNVEVWRPTSADNVERCAKDDIDSFRFVRVQSYNELLVAYKLTKKEGLSVTSCKVITLIGCIVLAVWAYN